jgi:hypothetical protein
MFMRKCFIFYEKYKESREKLDSFKMEKWTLISDYIKNERLNCYWFWFKGKITRKRNKETGEIYEQNLSGKLEWNGLRYKNGFYNFLQELFNKMKNGKYNGQTKAEFEKNYKRVKDIFEKSGGDLNSIKKNAQLQANRITDEWKALNRSFVAKELGHVEIFEIFFNRAYELGSVNKQDYRSYQLEKLGI